MDWSVVDQGKFLTDKQICDIVNKWDKSSVTVVVFQLLAHAVNLLIMCLRWRCT